MTKTNITKIIMKNKAILVVVAIAIIIFGAFSTTSLSTISYTTAYQGAQPQFYGATFNGRNYLNGDHVYDGHSTFSGTTMSFCAGYINGHQYPTITGEMTSVFIPTTSNTNLIPNTLGRDADGNPLQIPVSWVNSWTSSATANGDPSRTFEWDNNGKDYIMKEYQTKWYIALASSADQKGADTETWAYGRDPTTGPLQIWFKIDTNTNGWYFKGDGLRDTYFCVAKLLVSNAKSDGRIPNNVQYSPEVGGSAMSVFMQPFGQEAPSNVESQVRSNEGKQLNPTYFRDSVYCVVNLDYFGSQDWYDWLTFKSKGDTLALEITVYQFVVGEWIVQDWQDDPVDYIKPSPESTWGWDIGGWFESIPWTTWGGIGLWVALVILGLGALLLFWVFGAPRKGDTQTSRPPPAPPKKLCRFTAGLWR
jgi:hypothetical protein